MAQTQTLLEMTQEILEQMQSDEVTSITDTAESEAVARIIRRTYWDLFGPLDLPEHYTIFRLTETSASTPNLMQVPTNCQKLLWVKYNVETVSDTTDRFKDMYGPEDFKYFWDKAKGLVPTATNVSTYTFTFNPLGSDLVTVQYLNDRSPTCYSTPDDNYLLFDAVDTGVETFLRASKSEAFGLIDPTFTFSDSFTPDIDNLQRSLLFNEAKSQAFIDLKQAPNAKAEQRARMAKIDSQKTSQRVGEANPLDSLPDYGRPARGASYRTRPKSYNS